MTPYAQLDTVMTDQRRHPEPDPVTEAANDDAVARRIAGWWPKDLPVGALETDEVAFARGAVGAVRDVSDPKVAGQLLATCYAFACWLTSAGRPLAPDSFDDELIAAYRSTALADAPRGTQDAACSRLRKLKAAAGSQPVDPELLATAAPTEATGGFVPARIDPERFARLEPLVRDAARRARPTSERQTRDFVRWGAYLAGWAEARALPLRLDVVFSPKTVAAFMADLPTEIPVRSRATMASCLKAMSKAIFPDEPADFDVSFARGATPKPYAPQEIVALFGAATTHRSERLRRHYSALIAVGLGAGASGAEHNTLRPDDVVAAATGAVTVELGAGASRRTVTVLAPYAELVLGAARKAKEAGDTYLVGSTGTKNRANQLCAATTRRWDPPLEARRLRASYLVALAQTERPLLGFLSEAGVTTFETFNALLDDLRAADKSQRAAHGEGEAA